MSTTEYLRLAVMAILVVLSALTLVGVGSLALDSIRLLRRWRATR
jgi:hypothetical protein